MIMEKEKPNMSKLTQYDFRMDMSRIKNTVFIKGKTIIFVKLYILYFMIFKIIIKAATFGTNVPAKTASEVPSIPNLIESG